MKSATGRWVNGDDFFGRDAELRILEKRIEDRNHVLLSGQRRMGKTSIAQELGRRLQAQGWVFLFADVEGATCAEDVIAQIAHAVHPICKASDRFTEGLEHIKDWFSHSISDVDAGAFHLQFRANLSAGNWQRHGETLIHNCAKHDKPVLLVIDELPIFLKRILRSDVGEQRVDEFLSWLRRIFQTLDTQSPVLMVSGSIGLEPLVRRLGMSDRINYLSAFRLGPWSRETSISCIEQLSESHGLPIKDGVPDAVYEALGIGIPHHVQSFFARLRDRSMMRQNSRIAISDVNEVYQAELLGASGQNDLMHYETRLQDGLDEGSYLIAMEILAEAATQGSFSQDARRHLERLYVPVDEDVAERVSDALDVLVHDGYLEETDAGYRFPSRLLRDWWAARFRHHHAPLTKRYSR